MSWFGFFLVDRDDGFGDEVHVDNVHFVRRAKGKRGQSREEHERAHHVELRRFSVTRIAQNDARTKDRVRDVGQQFRDQCARRTSCARVRVIIGTVPIERLVFLDYLVNAMAGDGHGRDVAEPSQPMQIAGGCPALITSSVPRRLTFRQTFSLLRLSDAAQCMTESVVSARRR